MSTLHYINRATLTSRIWARTNSNPTKGVAHSSHGRRERECSTCMHAQRIKFLLPHHFPNATLQHEGKKGELWSKRRVSNKRRCKEETCKRTLSMKKQLITWLGEQRNGVLTLAITCKQNTINKTTSKQTNKERWQIWLPFRLPIESVWIAAKKL